ncbi:MAG TPA: hypothetical protein VKM94_25360 [Blastocatellia bacterium]|nr:hypothetical protein [Blastocatellia bacterium]
MKIEIASSNSFKNLREMLDRSVAVLPAEHLVGLEKIVVVDAVTEPRLSAAQRSTLPALYHPKMPGQRAWGEIAMDVVAPKKRFPKNLLTRLTLKASLAQVVISLVAQHHCLTLSKGIKKGQFETACRLYVEKHFDTWREREGGLRAKLFKPFKPYLDKFAKKLAKKYREEAAKRPSK